MPITAASPAAPGRSAGGRGTTVGIEPTLTNGSVFSGTPSREVGCDEDAADARRELLVLELLGLRDVDDVELHDVVERAGRRR